MKVEFGAINKDTAPKQIAGRIRESILTGKLSPLEKLPTEDELASLFGVSRPTIRETLKWLAADNLIEARRGATGGTFVKLPTPEDLQSRITDPLMIAASLDIFTFQEVIESRFALGEMCCRLAASNRTDEDIALLTAEIATQREKNLTDVEFCASDVRYHAALARATHNTIISVLAAGTIEGLEPITNLMLYRFRARQVLSDQHELLVAKLVERDVEGMVAVLKAQKEYLIEKQVEAKNWRTNKHKST
ncbi:FadR/GntR family transcriptional regulator [Sinorhizobium meliloti]|uniref:FadR/GntR family transcriptional regulator n=1 Tax=Rhizobium meliloti TaxID=382 RepID=UPI0003601A89|nr:GntR family transcriptional regulator [Sinorhizobium meliloti]